MTGYNLGNLTFLVVDDSPHMRTLIRSILQALGVRRCAAVGDGDAAFERLKSYPADVIICDWGMSETTGINFVRKVRLQEDCPNPFVPIILLTAYAELSRVLEARDAGIHEFLAKPISPRTLYSRVRAVIENPRPFIRVKDYFGPDRRRKKNATWDGEDRRKQDDDDLSDDADDSGSGSTSTKGENQSELAS